jgi:hypothetical protein
MQDEGRRESDVGYAWRADGLSFNGWVMSTSAHPQRTLAFTQLLTQLPHYVHRCRAARHRVPPKPGGLAAAVGGLNPTILFNLASDIRARRGCRELDAEITNMLPSSMVE